jgi:hypothetical protein
MRDGQPATATRGIRTCVSYLVAGPGGEHANQELLETLGVTDAADVAELLVRTRIEEAHARAPGALIIGAHQVISLNGKV